MNFGVFDGFVYADTETSGLSFINSDVIEVSFIFENSRFEFIGDLDMKINLPKNHTWDCEAESYHKISQVSARSHGVSQEIAIETINDTVEWMYNGNTNVAVVGANCYFDYVMLQNMYEKNKAGKIPFSYRLIDINQLGMYLGLGNRQADISKSLGVEIDKDNAHGAKYDASIHRELFKRMVDNEF